MPTLVILGIALAALGLLLTNAALIAWLIIRKRNKGSCAGTIRNSVSECVRVCYSNE